MNVEENQVIKDEYAKRISIVKVNGTKMIKKEFFQHSNMDVYLTLLNNPSEHIGEIYKIVESDYSFAVYEEYLGDTRLSDLSPIRYKEEAYDIIIQLCNAIRHLHQLNIVHRDLKPENIYYRNYKVMLNDFDISKPITKGSNIKKDTHTLGTEGYASPEQYGFSYSDERTDIYSLGIVINELFTGQHYQDHLVEGQLGDVVLKCVQINADDRYQTIDDLIFAIEAARAGKSKYTLPGFRTNKRRNKIIAIFGYFVIFGIALVAETEGGRTFNDHLQSKIIVGLAMLHLVIVATNYMNIRSLLPKSLQDRKVLGSFILWIITLFVHVLVIAIIEVIFKSMLTAYHL